MRKFILLFITLTLLSFPCFSYGKTKISSSASFIEDGSGNQINNLNEISYINPAFELDLLYSYGQIDNVKDQENLQASVTNIAPITDIFACGITNSFEYDYASELDRRISVSPHLRITPSLVPSLKASFFTGLDYSVYKYSERNHFDKYNLYTGSKLTYKLTPYLTAEEKIDYTPEIDDLNQYRVQSTTTVSLTPFTRYPSSSTLVERHNHQRWLSSNPIVSIDNISFDISYKYNYSTTGTKRKGLYAGISAVF